MTKKILLIIAICITITILYSMGQLLIPFLVGSVLAYALHVPARKLSKVCKFSQTTAAAILVLLAITIVAIFVLFLAPIIKNSLESIIKKLPDIIATLPDAINHTITKICNRLGLHETTFDIADFISKNFDFINIKTSKYLSHFVNTGVGIIYTILFIFMTPIITFYLLKDWQKIEIHTEKLLANNASTTLKSCITEINTNLGKYISGQLCICLILACVYILFLKIIGVNTYFVCGIFSGIMAFAPFLGPVIGCFATLASTIQDALCTMQYAAIIVLYIAIPFIDSNFITPKLIGDKIGMHPFWILFAICCTTSILGFSGIFIAVPLAVVVSTICKTFTKQLIA